MHAAGDFKSSWQAQVEFGPSSTRYCANPNTKQGRTE
jgi:hypothetical protein